MVLKGFFDEIGKRHQFSFNTLTCDSYPAMKGIKENEIPKKSLKFYHYSKSLIPNTEKMTKESDIIIINSAGFERHPSMKIALENLIKNLNPSKKILLINTFPTLNRNHIRDYTSIAPIKKTCKSHRKYEK